jgi:nascent polypeptide-associated complex subunit alpha
MMPGFGGINPKKMQSMMKQMGIQQDEIDTEKVIIERKDGGSIVISNPSVTKVNIQGQDTFQIMGDVSEIEQLGVNEEDVKLIMEKTGKSEEEAKQAMEETNDIAEAILRLTG